MATRAATVKYMAVDVGSLRLDTVKEFDLYLRVEDEEYVLYVSRENALTEQELAKLAEKKVKRLYVRSEQEEEYKRYVERHLPDIVRDPAVPAATKSRIVYEVSTSVVEDVFKEPRAETIQRSKDVISSTVTLILSDDEAARKLMQLTCHDYYTYTHSVNVCVFSVALAKKTFPSMSDDEFQRLGAGFTLHDVGKSSIPAKILTKQGPLNEKEWDIMRTHPEESARILRETGHLTDEASVIALQHHEWFNGSGYPNRLRADEIHEFAQICTIADVFDALTTNRPYRDGMKSFDALKIMKDEMYDHFSKEFFDQFILLFAEHP